MKSNFEREDEKRKEQASVTLPWKEFMAELEKPILLEFKSFPRSVIKVVIICFYKIEKLF